MVVNKPPMGWNSWNTYAEKIDEALILESARALKESGLADAGYNYVVIDDCWALHERGKDGKLVPDPEKFPRGMKALADEIHALGLKFGMYSCSGLMTCARYPSSLDREWIDAKTFAEWGVDFLKYDYCYKPLNRRGEELYRAMQLALANSGREILLSACSWGADKTHEWIRSTGSGMWRSTGDIFDNWNSIKSLILQQMTILPYGGRGCFNDMDMLVVGMNGKGNVGLGGCTEEEYRTHFGAWCMLQSPLMIGCDVRNMSEFTRSLLTNPMLLSIDQDPLCAQTFRLDSLTVDFDPNKQDCCILARMLEGGDIALGFFNLSDSVKNLHCTLNDIGLGVSSGMTLEMCDCFTGEKRSPICGTVSAMGLQPHACKVYRCKVVKA